jgi:hypothetical protein
MAHSHDVRNVLDNDNVIGMLILFEKNMVRCNHVNNHVRLGDLLTAEFGALKFFPSLFQVIVTDTETGLIPAETSRKSTRTLSS